MRQNEKGEVNVLLIVVVLVSIIAAGFAGAFIWAFGEMNHYQNDSDAIVATAVEEAKAEQETLDQAWFTEEAKKPNLAYAGPQDFGAVKFSYPKTWASYNADNSSAKYSVYFNPTMVANTTSKSVSFALRLTVENKSYESTLKTFESAASKGEVTVTPVNVGDGKLSGMRVDGQLEKDHSGSIAIFKIRDKTLTVRTDGDTFMNDFNNTVLATLTFEP